MLVIEAVNELTLFTAVLEKFDKRVVKSWAKLAPGIENEPLDPPDQP
jgi:hypothetical protein